LRHAGRPQDAAIAVERGRAVLLTRALALDSAAVARFAVEGPQPLVERFRDAAMLLTTLVARAGDSTVDARGAATSPR